MTGGTLRSVAVLVEDEFDAAQLDEVCTRLRAAGVGVTLIGPFASREYRARERDRTVVSDAAVTALRLEALDAVIVPGGYAADRLRMRHAVVDLVRDAAAAGKPVAAVGHGVQLLISAGIVRGRTLTCWPSIAIDVRNAGGRYVDRPVVEDPPLITSRKLDDVPALCAALLDALGRARP